MNEYVLNVLLSVAGNALTALLANFGQGTRKLLIGETRDPNKLEPLLKDAAEKLSDTVDWAPPPPLEEVCLFLVSPEVESLIRQIYATRLLNLDANERLELKSIKQEFVMALALFTDTTVDKLGGKAEVLFDSLVEAAERSLNHAISEGRLSAHEAKSELRHRIIMGELATIQKNINFLASRQKLNATQLHEFEVKYREQVADRHKDIVPPDFDIARRLPIDKLYVQPRFFSDSDIKSERGRPLKRGRPLTSRELKSSAYRTVILGNPGGGKSTFTQKLCFDLATRYEERQLAGRRLTPVVVVLRDYGTEKRLLAYLYYNLSRPPLTQLTK